MIRRENSVPVVYPADDTRGATTMGRLSALVPAVIAICVGCVLSVGAYLIFVTLENDEHRNRFNQVAESRFDQIEKRIDRTVSVLRSIVGLYAGSVEVGRAEFHAFVRALGEQPAVQALEWIPRVSQSRRSAFEGAAREYGFSGFAFIERHSQGNMVRASTRSEYFPVYFVEPYAGNEAALGFDLSSNPARLDALNRARDSGKMVASSRITLIQETGDQYGFLVFAPIYQNGAPRESVAERRTNLIGFGLGVFRIGDLASAPIGEISSSRNPAVIQIFDQSAPEESRRLYPRTLVSEGDADDLSDYRNTRTLNVAGRNWLLVATPTVTFVKEIGRPWQRWIVLLAGLLFTGMVALYLKLIVGRTREIGILVAERTVKLTRANEELEVVNNELDAFADSVSHDLRAPLRGLDGFSQALMEDHADRLDGEALDFLNRISRASRRMGQMIDDILTLSRATRQDIQTQQVNLSALAQDLLAELSNHDPDRNVTIEIAPNITVQGDPKLLQVVLANLLGNAWKFTSNNETAKIEFGLYSKVDGPVYFVRDDGAGFDMAYVDKLFGIFQRLHSVTEFEGTGVGLATVARLVRRHGGRVWAEGEENKGAIFYFTLTRENITGRN